MRRWSSALRVKVMHSAMFFHTTDPAVVFVRFLCVPTLVLHVCAGERFGLTVSTTARVPLSFVQAVFDESARSLRVWSAKGPVVYLFRGAFRMLSSSAHFLVSLDEPRMALELVLAQSCVYGIGAWLLLAYPLRMFGNSSLKQTRSYIKTTWECENVLIQYKSLEKAPHIY